MKAKLFVVLQFSFIFIMSVILLNTNNIHSNLLNISAMIAFFSLVIGFFAIMKNKIGNFNIRPTIKDDSILITNGIYAYIRHPMYLSVLLLMLSILIISFSIIQLCLYLLLFVTLIYKLKYEENLWRNNSIEYSKYMDTTKRLIPYIY